MLSATIGAGHDATTGELARRLRARGFEVECRDFMDLLPFRLGRGAVHGHYTLLRRAPWFYGLLFDIGERYPTTPPMTRLMLYPLRHRLLRSVDEDVAAVVAVYPLATQVVGPLRRSGRLASMAITYATDFGVHRHWVSPGIDVTLTPHAVGVEQARRHGARQAVVAGAVVGDRFRPAAPGAKAAARERLGLPPGRLALVVAGSWGVGEIEATAADIARTGVAVPVIACGRNTALRERLVRQGMPYVLGWVDDMATLMQSVDVLVENAGGSMALEGMACGVPVLTYRPIPGHGRRSALAQERAGITTWVRRRQDLGPALIELADGPAGRRQRLAADDLFTVDAADRIAEVLTRSETTPAPERPAKLLSTVAAAAALVLTVAAMRTRRRRPS